jgi:hypothetical protein
MFLSVKSGERDGWTGIMMRYNDVTGTGNPPGFSQTFPDMEICSGYDIKSSFVSTLLLHHATRYCKTPVSVLRTDGS